MKMIVAVTLLVAVVVGGIPFALLLMTVNLYGGLVAAGVLALLVWGMTRFIDRQLAWGKPKPGKEVPGESWKYPQSPGGGMGGGI